MSHYFYITPEEYEQAAAVGISKRTLEQRVQDRGWSKEKALSTPTRKKHDRSHWRAVAASNGISSKIFYDRLVHGKWTEERAATEAPCTPEQRRQNAQAASECNRRYPREIIELRKQNGINRKTFHHRVNVSGWSLERAATEPVWTREQACKLGTKRLREREGDWAALIFGKRTKEDCSHAKSH